MTPQLLSYDQQAHDVELGFANQDLAIYNTFLSAIQAAEPSITWTIAAINSLLANPILYAFNAITNNTPVTVDGLPVPQEQAMQMIQIPTGWQTIISLANNLNADLQTNTVYQAYSIKRGNRLFNRLSLANVEIDSGVFALTSAYTTALTAKYQIYTSTDQQNTVLTLLTNIYDNLTALKTAGASFTSDYTLRQLGVMDTTTSSVLSYDPTSFVTLN